MPETYDPRRTYARQDEWNCGLNITGNTRHPDKVELRCFKILNSGDIVRHPDHDGREFPTVQDGNQYMLDSGLIHEWIRRSAPHCCG